MTYLAHNVLPPPPVNPPLGTIWVSDDQLPEDGPLASPKLSALAEGLIRVEKVCRRCGNDFDGWMFLAHYRRREAKLEEPYHVGPYRACDRCVGQGALHSQIADLETKIARVQARWETARMLVKKIPTGRELARLLDQLVGLLQFGSDRFRAASDRLDAVREWLDEQQVAEV